MSGWRASGRGSSQGDFGVVQCQVCKKLKRISIAKHLRTNVWPECHNDVMVLLPEDLADDEVKRGGRKIEPSEEPDDPDAAD